ncbi:hypothetical protein Dda_3969 [Drechslerella dactyloides]|uniref:Cytochrome b5 heme-binding domain-containing protein n=1 Tax=Drechslerella dactyloides TaxID=74499 RepID=A0AAD6J176_DREDA|nr:hypothetical protein Dda_3969 [Drechslerella dactyloides]
MAAQEVTYTELLSHDTKEDLYVAIHEKVYNVTRFVDEHPGGEEVLLDVGGQDATEAFEDVGHSDEAREILSGYLVGDLKRGANDPKPSSASENRVSLPPGEDSAGGIFLITISPSFVYAIVVAGLAGGAYYYLQLQQQQTSA